MRQIDKKNYVILVGLLVGTVFLTLFIADVYKTKNKHVSEFYKYSNKINSKEFEVYNIENSDFIIYISDKYDLEHESFEIKLKQKIEQMGLKDKLIFIDKKELNKDFINLLKNNYGISIESPKIPMVIVIVDNALVNSAYVDDYLNIDTFIDYEVFE